MRGPALLAAQLPVGIAVIQVESVGPSQIDSAVEHGYGADQAGMQRFLTTRSLRHSQWAAAAAMVGTAVAGASLFLLGVALYAFYFLHPEKQGIGLYPDRVFPKFIIEELPAGATGLLIASVLAAAMSTISSAQVRMAPRAPGLDAQRSRPSPL